MLVGNLSAIRASAILSILERWKHSNGTNSAIKIGARRAVNGSQRF